jgi:hypothetical protein
MGIHKAATMVVDADTQRNLRRIALAQGTNLSCLIRQISEKYVKDYLKEVESK